VSAEPGGHVSCLASERCCLSCIMSHVISLALRLVGKLANYFVDLHFIYRFVYNSSDLYARFDTTRDRRRKYFSNVYNLQCFFSYWELRHQTPTRSSAPGPSWGTSVPKTPSKIGPPKSKNPTLLLLIDYFNRDKITTFIYSE